MFSDRMTYIYGDLLCVLSKQTFRNSVVFDWQLLRQGLPRQSPQEVKVLLRDCLQSKISFSLNHRYFFTIFCVNTFLQVLSFNMCDCISSHWSMDLCAMPMLFGVSFMYAHACESAALVRTQEGWVACQSLWFFVLTKVQIWSPRHLRPGGDRDREETFNILL